MNVNLTGFSFLVTRPLPQGWELCQRIQALQGQAVCFPTIAFKSLTDQPAFQQSLTQLGEQDWLIFISPQAVTASIVAIRQQWPQFSPSVQFAAVGKSTVKALQAAGYYVAASPEVDWTSEGLLALPGIQHVQGQRMAIIRGVGGRGLLEQVLTERGAKILSVVAYERVLPPVTEEERQQAQQAFSAIIYTSHEVMRNLETILGEGAVDMLKNTPLIVPSQRLKVLAEQSGYRRIWVSRNASHEAILETIKELSCQNKLPISPLKKTNMPPSKNPEKNPK